MNIIETTNLAKIPYKVSGKSICFDDDLTINLSKREQDWSVHIDVCFDRDRNLVIGAAAGRTYVAQISIPARQYETTGDGEDQEQKPIPLDMKTITLSLWAIE